MYAIEFTDLHGRRYRDGARRADKVRTLELVRYYRKLLGRDGQFMTGAIPGGGIAVDVRMVEV